MATDFQRCQDVLDGRPPPPTSRSTHSDKLLRFVTTSHGDLIVTPGTIAWVTPSGRRHTYITSLGPRLLHTLLHDGGIPSPVHSAAAIIPAGGHPPYPREEVAVWLVRSPDEIRLLFRAPAAPLLAPLVPIPDAGPWALPPLATVAAVTRGPKVYAENTQRLRCPHCQTVPDRVRGIGGRWVCGGCARSFEAPA